MAENQIFIVSDGTGETATKMSKAALLQFQPANTVFARHSNVRSAEEIDGIARKAHKSRALVIHTFASSSLRLAMENACQKHLVPSHDVLAGSSIDWNSSRDCPPERNLGCCIRSTMTTLKEWMR